MIILSIFALVSAWIAISAPRLALITLVALAPWQGLEAEIGLRLTAYRILAACMLAAYALGVGGRSRRAVLPAAMLTFMLIAVGRSIIQVAWLPDEFIGGGILRSPFWRAVSQILMFFVDFSPIFFVPRIVRNTVEVIRLGRVYVVSCVVLSVLGWYQVGTWLLTGNNLFPIGCVAEFMSPGSELVRNALREGIAVYGDVRILRMSALGGEPKTLAIALAISLVMLQLRIYSNGFRKTYVLTWIFLFVSMIQTLSTSGFYLWVIGTAAVYVLSRTMRLENATKHVTMGRVVLALFAFVAMTTIFTGVARLFGLATSFNWWELAQDRIFGRDPLEDFDIAVLQFLIHDPMSALFGVGLGNAHLYSRQFLPAFATYAEESVFVAKSGYLKLISETGVIGLLFFTTGAYRMCGAVIEGKEARYAPIRDSQAEIYLLGITMLLMYLARGNYVAPEAFIVLGVARAWVEHRIDSDETSKLSHG